jgi:hypothetical protein
VSRSQFLDINRAGCAPPNGNAGASTWQRIFPLLSNVNVVRKVSFTTSFGLAFWSVKRCLIASRTSEELRVTDPDSRVSLTCVAVSTSSSRFGSLTTVAKSSIDPPGVRVRAGFDSGRGELWSPERHRRARCRKPAGLFLSANHASSCWYLCWYRQQYKKKFAFNSIGYGTRRLSARGTTLRPLGFAWHGHARPKGEACPAKLERSENEDGQSGFRRYAWYIPTHVHSIATSLQARTKQ